MRRLDAVSIFLRWPFPRNERALATDFNAWKQIIDCADRDGDAIESR